MSILSIGQELRVRIQADEDFYKSRLVEETSNGFLIDVPLHIVDSRSLLPSEASSILVEFHAQDGAICRFESAFSEVTYVPVPAWRIERPTPDQISREQRREFVRVQAHLPVRISLADSAAARPIETHSRDISGGGMAVFVPPNFPVEVGSLVIAKFTLPHNEFSVDVKCEVIRIAELTDNDKLLLSLRFDSIKDAIQQRIIQYTFLRQRAANR